MTHQIYGYGYPEVSRIVTACQGAWYWQKAFRWATYAPMARADGRGYYWVSQGRSGKFAKLASTRGQWEGEPNGSLHLKPAIRQVDDYGNEVFVTLA